MCVPVDMINLSLCVPVDMINLSLCVYLLTGYTYVFIVCMHVSITIIGSCINLEWNIQTVHNRRTRNW